MKMSFEILAKVGAVQKFRDGKLGFGSVMFSDDIFVGHYAKAERAKPADLKAAFGDISNEAILQEILRKGECQFTADERKEKVEQKRREIVNYIHKYFLDPRSKTPHPVTRIENALDVLKVHPDPDLPLDRQIQDIVKHLPEVLPVKRCEIEATLVVPNALMGGAAGVISKFAQIGKESYTDAGCSMEITLVPGDYDALVAELAKVTKGDFQIDIHGVEKTAPAASDEASPKGGKGGKRGGRGGKKGR